ncbi:MAG: DEAD/DEAH box helicase family protein [Lewinellaceae bacterium]|nr:DEAD/DEAH box helicase family protein [Lewinellaceae bacterium]
MNDEKQEAIAEALAGLKDFQRATVDYVFGKLFWEGRRRMLVADEVGLGKTIVAKGIIAKAYEQHLKNRPEEEFHVIYICSNQALAHQNLKKLNLFPSEDIKSIERLVFLAKKPEGTIHNFRISSLTPGTSFYITKSSGKREERKIIFKILNRYKYFRDNRNNLIYLLLGTIENIDSWKREISEFLESDHEKIRPTVFSRFKKILQNTIIQNKGGNRRIFVDLDLNEEEENLWSILKRYCKNRTIYRSNYKDKDGRFSVIRHLRTALTKVCLEYLDADLFILDEFQRFKPLINREDKSEAATLAKDIFNIEHAKVLMLSATPYKPYTTRFDQEQGEDHYAEFRTVLQFLSQEKKQEFWLQYEKDRRAFFQLMRRPELLHGRLEDVKSQKKSLEETYRQVMVRTERLLVSEDHNAMIHTLEKEPFLLEAEDILDFIRIDSIVLKLNEYLGHKVATPLEFAKSAPFALSFLDHYKIKERLKEYKDIPELKQLLYQYPEAWIDHTAVNEYKQLLMPNGKLRQLVSESLQPCGYRLLWVPPSLPYYSFGGAFQGAERFSKVLVFSSWVMAPRMIASILSYEAERLTIGNPKTISDQEKGSKRRYFPPAEHLGSYRRHPRPQLLFKVQSEAPRNMTNFCLLYPSPSLGRMYNPRKNIGMGESIEEIKARIKGQIDQMIQETRLEEQYRTEGGEQNKWYWALPLLLDRLDVSDRKFVEAWFNSGDIFSSYNTDSESSQQEEREEKGGKRKHFEELKKGFFDPLSIGLGPIPEDIGEVIAEMVLGSPAVSALRSLEMLFNNSLENMQGAAIIANGFLSLFNKPESISTLRLEKTNASYWQMVLKYGIDGNLQAMLDEYLYLLYECENYRETATGLASHVADVMTIRTSNIRVDSLDSFINEENRSMRCHFALDYGNQKIETTAGKDRMINLRETFNSPFRPFVLASTSIGQEGLDFHYYCRKVMHWNLPSNAIDIEQREGRVSRFKGLVIRQNLAQKYCDALEENEEVNIWKALFEIAQKNENGNGKCELVPFWHIEGAEGIKVERIIPLHPFSRDIQKLKNLLEVLTLYRLTFGQPRQEELVETFQNANLSEEELQKIREELMINLSPVVFNQHTHA